MSVVTPFPQSDYDPPSRVGERWDWLAGKDIFRATLLFLAGSVAIFFGGLAFTLKDGVDWMGILTWICYLGLAAYALVALRALIQLFASDIYAVANLAEAVAETLVRIDLNRSGAIGDVKKVTQIEQPKEPTPPPAEPATGRLDVESTNKANETYYRAVKIFEATMIQLSKVKDGDTVSKPFTFRNCKQAGFCRIYEDWSDALKLWERAGIAENPEKSDWKIPPTTFEAGVGKMDDCMEKEGYIKTRTGEWMKR